MVVTLANKEAAEMGGSTVNGQRATVTEQVMNERQKGSLHEA